MTKTNRILHYIIALVLTGGVLVGCSDSDHSNGNTQPAALEDIVDTAIAADNFNTLVAVVQAAGLEETLRQPGPYTVFAPTDAAFSAIPTSTLNNLVTNLNKAPLNDILKYHIFDGEVRANDAITLTGQSVAMINGDMLSIDSVGGGLELNSGGRAPASVISTDILASNGVIHVIDVVLEPADGKSNIMDKLDNLGNFTTLISAVQAAGLEATLSGGGPFTLFAPTDSAFGKISTVALNNLLNDLNTLSDVLTYHAIGAEVFSVDAGNAGGSMRWTPSLGQLNAAVKL